MGVKLGEWFRDKALIIGYGVVFIRSDNCPSVRRGTGAANVSRAIFADREIITFQKMEL